MQPLRLLQRLRDQGRHELDRDWEGGYCGENSKRQLDRCGCHLHHQTVDGVAFSPKIEEHTFNKIVIIQLGIFLKRENFHGFKHYVFINPLSALTF